MPISDWNCPARLITPEGTLFFNNTAQTEGYYVQIKESCDAGADTRATRSPVPQAGGAILNRGFDDGYLLKLAIAYFAEPDEPACGTTDPTLSEMDDLLMKHLRSILDGGGRYIFTPPGQQERLLDELRLFQRPVISVESGLTGVQFTLASPFPYTIDFNQTLTQLDAGSPSAVLVNLGSAPFWPVFKVYGPFDSFQLENADAVDDDGNPMIVLYHDILPGALPVGPGSYVEIDCFRNTVYLNGNGPSRKAGIDIIRSDFFPLVVGNNTITVTGGGSNAAPDVDILWQPAWY